MARDPAIRNKIGLRLERGLLAKTRAVKSAFIEHVRFYRAFLFPPLVSFLCRDNLI